jgi:hypothetical protein
LIAVVVGPRSRVAVSEFISVEIRVESCEMVKAAIRIEVRFVKFDRRGGEACDLAVANLLSVSFERCLMTAT